MTILLDHAHPDSDKTLDKSDLLKLTCCPLCKSELIWHYGLAMGGIGGYVFCDNERCTFERKAEDAEDAEKTEGNK